MAAGGTTARRSAALLLGAVLSLQLILGVPSPAMARPGQDGGESQPCDPLQDPAGCVDPPPSSETTTTSTEVVTTTTEEETTTTAARRTTTTVVDIVEEVTTTTLPVATSVDLLVPGDGTEGAESTTTTETVAVAAVSDDGPSDGTLIALVVAGLVAIAIAVAVLTWRYWVATRPAPVDGDQATEPTG